MVLLVAVFLVVGVVGTPRNCDDQTEFCLSHKDVSNEFQPQIERLKAKLAIISKFALDRIGSSRTLIQTNIADAGKFTALQLAASKRELISAKSEATSAPKIQLCLNRLGLQLGRLQPQSYAVCNANANFTTLLQIKNKFAKLEQTVQGLVNHCVLLNPLRSAFPGLRACLELNIKEIELQVVLIEGEFEQKLRDVLNYSANCVMRANGEVAGKIGGVLMSIKNCKEFFA